MQAVEVLKNVRTEPATLALRQAATSADLPLQLGANAALLWRNDISAFSSAVAVLLNPPAGADKVLLRRLAASVEGVSDAAAVPLLNRLIRARDAFLRRAAASALRHTAVDAAINPLLAVLNDPDREVRYQAVIGLAELTGQYDWAPSIDLFQRDEQAYLSHWRTWGQTR